MNKTMNMFNEIITIFTSFVLLNLLWLLFCLPVMTIFPATAALFGTVRKWIRVGLDVGVYRVFVQEFKMNFKKSIGLGAVWTIFFAIISVDLAIVLQNEFTGKSIVLTMLVFFMLLFVFTSIYLFLLIVHYDLSLFHTVKNSLLLSLGHLNYTVLFLAMILLVLIVSYYFPFFLLLCGSLLAFMMYGVFHKLSLKWEEGKNSQHKLNTDIT
ncbi:YesL family protein [Mesobacillus selenatarsenatis]|uniref:DUF624 domain-containing protein n=1 Tax=Mesobacillus selenatarsenatis (strain DSM 18680 / JCM 14380 / FERM P-15431 / SF-1) TaxID=1321606 RepID=A0A0A8X016_MESS1|nr:DUF624 domain-containing protein [Mesobacillus selenatarsenatis]GAM12342.1 hypothetical protein SAMD00020551_0474 [Mesobacillus selenatarsenatis SF-1]